MTECINFFRPVIWAAIVLTIPALAMFFSVDGWAWGPLDFVIMAALIYTAGLAYEFFALKARSGGQRILIGLGVIFVLGLTWVELATDAVSRLMQSMLT